MLGGGGNAMESEPSRREDLPHDFHPTKVSGPVNRRTHALRDRCDLRRLWCGLVVPGLVAAGGNDLPASKVSQIDPFYGLVRRHEAGAVVWGEVAGPAIF